jgi:flagellar motor protein MotB
MFTDAADESVGSVGFQFDSGEITASLMTGRGHSDYEGHPHASIKVEYGKLVRLAVWFQDSRIRGYVNGQRAFDVNQVEFNVGDTPTYIVSARIADALTAQAALEARIEGHTDSSGDAAKNLDLSKRRAESVKSALVKLRIAADRLTTDGLGQTKPMAPNDTPQGRAENRRVEFVKL